MPFFTSEWSLKFQHVPPSMSRSDTLWHHHGITTLLKHPVFNNNSLRGSQQEWSPGRVGSWMIPRSEAGYCPTVRSCSNHLFSPLKCTSKKPRCVECVDSQRVKQKRKAILTTEVCGLLPCNVAHVLLPLKIHATRQELIKLNQKIVWDARSECRSFETWGSHSHHIFLAYF